MTRLLIFNALCLLALALTGSVVTSDAQVRASFNSVCGTFRGHQQYYFEECYMDPDIFPDFLNDVLAEAVRKYDSKKTVDQLLRDLLPKTTEYFAVEYPEYQTELEDLKSRMSKLGESLSKSTEDVRVSDINKAFEESGMQKVYEIFRHNGTKPYNCTSGSDVCSNTNNLFGIKRTEDWVNLTLHQVIQKALDNSMNFETMKHNTLVQVEKSIINLLIGNLKDSGTSGVNVAQIQNFLNTNYFKTIVQIYKYNGNLPITSRPPQNTTERPNITTTVVNKVLDIVAVSPEVYLSVSITIFMLGVVGTIVFLIMAKSRPGPVPQPQQVKRQQMSSNAPQPEGNRHQVKMMQQPHTSKRREETRVETLTKQPYNRPAEQQQQLPPPYQEPSEEIEMAKYRQENEKKEDMRF